jgi:hypothetical protein
VNRSCLLFFAASRTPLNPWDTGSPLCVGLVVGRTIFSLARTLFLVRILPIRARQRMDRLQPCFKVEASDN